MEYKLLKNYFRDYILSQEHQRKYIAETLQNSINQSITSANLKMNSLLKEKSITNKIRKDANDLNILLSNLSKEVTFIAGLSFPLVLLSLGLDKALEDLCNKYSKEFKTNIDMCLNGSIFNMPVEININVYRLIESILLYLNKIANFFKIKIVLKTHKKYLIIELTLLNEDYRILNEKILDVKKSYIINIIRLFDGNYSFVKQINNEIKILIKIPVKYDNKYEFNPIK